MTAFNKIWSFISYPKEDIVTNKNQLDREDNTNQLKQITHKNIVVKEKKKKRNNNDKDFIKTTTIINPLEYDSQGEISDIKNTIVLPVDENSDSKKNLSNDSQHYDEIELGVYSTDESDELIDYAIKKKMFIMEIMKKMIKI